MAIPHGAAVIPRVSWPVYVLIWFALPPRSKLRLLHPGIAARAIAAIYHVTLPDARPPRRTGSRWELLMRSAQSCFEFDASFPVSQRARALRPIDSL